MSSLKYFLLFLFIYNCSYSQIYSNGNLSTGLVSKSGITAPTDYTWSELQNNLGNTTECNKSTGFAGYFNTAETSSFQLADNFTVPVGEHWSITSFDFFAHQNSFTGLTIPMDQLRIQIWTGDPSLPGSTLVAGDMTTNVLDATNSVNTFMYRIPNSIIGSPAIAPNPNRKIWKVRGNISSELNSGEYWVVYQFHATDNGTIFVPTVTVPDTRTLDGWNAKQNFVANTTPGTILGWANIKDLGDPGTAADVAQDLPFLINGNVTLSTSENDFSSSVVVYPNPVKSILTINNSSNNQVDSASIYDVTGRKVLFLDKIYSSIDVSELSSGNYILKIKSGELIAIKRFIKE
jgi:hypothetical protein